MHRTAALSLVVGAALLLGGAMLTVAVIALSASLAPERAPAGPAGVPGAAARPTPAEEPEPPPGAVMQSSANGMSMDWDANEVAAAGKYAGKWMKFMGVVDRVHRGNGRLVIDLAGYQGVNPTRVYLRDGQDEQARTLERFGHVVIVGFCQGREYGRINVIRGRIVSP